jgi:NitT/TauT family transport system ATP-binding protein
MPSQAAAPHPDPLVVPEARLRHDASGEREKRTFVEIENVTHAYGGEGGVIAVDKLTLSIAEGEFAAVVGPSGCGKSTLMKLVTGLQFPQAGAIAVGGAKVAGPLKIAGMAFQAPSLLPWRSTLENILLPLEIVQPHRKRLRSERGAYIAKVEALLAQVGLGGLGAKYPWELSGGMQQRASLCRALIHEPQLLMLDEPFAALDSFTREELWCVMRDLHAARPVTIILVTHDLREAAFLADRVFCMSARPGRIIAERRVTFPRPRSLEVTYTTEFTDLVHDLRSQIATARQA